MTDTYGTITEAKAYVGPNVYTATVTTATGASMALKFGASGSEIAKSEGMSNAKIVIKYRDSGSTTTGEVVLTDVIFGGELKAAVPKLASDANSTATITMYVKDWSVAEFPCVSKAGWFDVATVTGAYSTVNTNGAAYSEMNIDAGKPIKAVLSFTPAGTNTYIWKFDEIKQRVILNTAYNTALNSATTVAYKALVLYR